MSIGLIYHGKDRDIVVFGNTLKEAESIFQKNRKEILKILKMPTDMPTKKQNVKVLHQLKTAADLLLDLKKRNFFYNPKSGNEIIEELKSMDFHFKLSDLTLPLRTLVRSSELERTKSLPGKGKSRYWMWVAPDIPRGKE